MYHREQHRNNKSTINSEAFATTQFNDTFWCQQPRQDIKVSRRFCKKLRPSLQGVAVGLEEPKTNKFMFPQTTSQYLQSL